MLALVRICAVSVLLGAAAAAQPVRVADINVNTPPNPSSLPHYFVPFQQRTYFIADTPATGPEVFVTDGTAAGTTLVADVVPGRSGTSRILYGAKNGLVGIHGNSTVGMGVWVSDGTPAGTTIVSGVDSHRYPVHYNGWLYFGASHPSVGAELFRSDGTATGTQLVADLIPGSGSSRARALGVFNNKLYFTAFTAAGSALYETDGLSTNFLTQITPPAFEPETLGAAANYILLSNRSGWIWRSDGTSNPTTFVTAVPALAEDWVFASGLLYFVPNDNPRFVWVTDGTAAGTQPTSVQVWPVSRLAAYRGSVYFSGWTSAVGSELFRITGRTVSLFADLDPAGSSSPRSLSVLNNELFFEAATPGRGIELWKTDGTTAGTRIVRDIGAGASSGLGHGYGISVANNRLWFGGDDGTTGAEPWSSDGTAAGTNAVIDLSPQPPGTLGADPSGLVDFDGIALFAADDGQLGQELYRTDGTAAGTTLVRDLTPGPGSSRPLRLTVVDTQVFFQANGNEVWRTDATAAGTRRLLTATGGLAGFATIRDRAVFHAITSTGSQMWASDGTVSGTQPLTPPGVGGSTSSISHAVLGDTLYYRGYESSSGWQLWGTDGTAANTRKIADIDPSGSADPTYLTELNGQLFFAADDGINGRELWVSDGTAQGTTLFFDLVPGRVSGTPRFFVRSGGNLYFLAGTSLWVTDATRSGTKPISPGSVLAGPPDQPLGDGGLLFTANQGGRGNEPWATDGTAAGTRLLRDIYPGPSTSRHNAGVTPGTRFAYFQALDGVTGREPWVTDGTPAGTKQVADLLAGSQGSTPFDFLLLRGKVLFSATGDSAGRELWSLDPGASWKSVGYGCGRGARSPGLRMDDPVLAAALRFRGDGTFTGSTVSLFLGLGHPRSLGLSPDCRIYVNPAGMALIDSFVAPGRTWTRTLGNVPASPVLVGAPFSVQALYVGTDALRGFDLSSGLRLVVGR